MRVFALTALVVATACAKRDAPPANAPVAAGLATGDRPTVVAASPATAQELPLAAGDSVIDVAAWPTGPDAIALVRDGSGAAHVTGWRASDKNSIKVVDLPPGFVPRSIAVHPTRRTAFVSGEVAGKSQILSLTESGQSWQSATLFETPNKVGRLVVSARPFYAGDSVRYRVFFAATLRDGATSLRSITETGKIEYQVAGPKSGVVSVGNVEDQPKGEIEASATPMNFHPRGEPLLWQDGRGCAHSSSYSDKNWSEHVALKFIPCGGSVRITPNGAAYLTWSAGQPGIIVRRADGRSSSPQASTYTFLAMPTPTPDGQGVIGVVGAGGHQSLVYAPIDLPLGDVVNAWQLGATGCEEQRFTRDGGLFKSPSTNQLYTLLEDDAYSGSYRKPPLVTTDLLWENFGAAFSGTFIILERRQAMPAFWAFVDAANNSLAKSAPSSLWGKAFAALTAVEHGTPSDEATRIANDSTKQRSSVIDAEFDFAELKPRGHYTTSDEMRRYFRAVHYFTEVGRLKDPAPLASLPADVQQKALDWIDVYQSFIAQPRGKLVWNVATAPPIAAYAKHPNDKTTVFPLSWGLDNEVLESTVYHSKWPEPEQIIGPRGIREYPSGVDIAAAYGDVFARGLLSADIAKFPRFGPVLDGLIARRPRIDEESSIYDRWVDALGQEWADSAAFPSAPSSSKLWAAKRLQTGLASWATLRETTVLVNERPQGIEAGEGGFEELLIEPPRGYVEPVPKTFEGIAQLYESLARRVRTTRDFGSTGDSASDDWKDKPLKDGILRRLAASAAEARGFARMAEKELRGEALADSEYAAIRDIRGSAEHQFLIYRSLADKQLAISTPDPMPKIADVAGDLETGVLEAAVGGPMEWRQVVPYFGRREIAVGSVYSYYEFVSTSLYDNQRWRKEVDGKPNPSWIAAFIAENSCGTPGR